MPCYHPLTAYKAAGGGITFNEGGDSGPKLQLPCGRCIGCRIQRTQHWAMRCMHEAKMHKENAFLTLTYGGHCEPSLNYADFQNFLRKLRRSLNHNIRFFVAGEYGDQGARPHWHCIIFGHRFRDTYPVGRDLSGSHQLDTLWGRGFASQGEVTPQSAAYVAAYSIKKATGPLAIKKYTRVNIQTGETITVRPEFARMSLKPGIGEQYFRKYYKDIYYARDGIVAPGGRTSKPPRYYDKLLQQLDTKQATDIETNRQLESIQRQEDNTTNRLLSKEINAIAKTKLKRRKL